MGERENMYCLGGSVEMDEAFFGGKAAGKRGRGSENKTKVAVALQLDSAGHPQFLKMQAVPDAKGSTLLAFAKNNVSTGSTIHSDAFRSYNALSGDYCCDMQKYDPKSGDGRLKMAPCNDFEYQGKYRRSLPWPGRDLSATLP